MRASDGACQPRCQPRQRYRVDSMDAAMAGGPSADHLRGLRTTSRSRRSHPRSVVSEAARYLAMTWGSPVDDEIRSAPR